MSLEGEKKKPTIGEEREIGKPKDETTRKRGEINILMNIVRTLKEIQGERYRERGRSIQTIRVQAEESRYRWKRTRFLICARNQHQSSTEKAKYKNKRKKKNRLTFFFPGLCMMQGRGVWSVSCFYQPLGSVASSFFSRFLGVCWLVGWFVGLSCFVCLLLLLLPHETDFHSISVVSNLEDPPRLCSHVRRSKTMSYWMCRE